MSDAATLGVLPTFRVYVYGAVLIVTAEDRRAALRAALEWYLSRWERPHE